MPVVCGGHNYEKDLVYDTCHFYDSSADSWENYANMTEQRVYYAMGQLSLNDFWILGKVQFIYLEIGNVFWPKLFVAPKS